MTGDVPPTATTTEPTTLTVLSVADDTLHLVLGDQRLSSVLSDLYPDEVDVFLTDLLGRRGEPGLECYPPVG